MLEKERSCLLPASSFPETTPNWERDVLAETEQILASLPAASGPTEQDMITAEEKEDQPTAGVEQVGVEQVPAGDEREVEERDTDPAEQLETEEEPDAFATPDPGTIC